MLYVYLYVFNKYNFCKQILIPFFIPFKYVLIAAHEKFLILKNGSDYQGAWPSLLYDNVDLMTEQKTIFKLSQ